MVSQYDQSEVVSSQHWCITGDDTDEEDSEGGQHGEDEGVQPQDDDAVAMQQDRQASHAHASTKDADSAKVPVTHDGGESCCSSS